MMYMRNSRAAAAVVGTDDINRLNKEGVKTIALAANLGCLKAKACMQRLVNSGLLAEGCY